MPAYHRRAHVRRGGLILAPAILLLAAACGRGEGGTGIASLQDQEAAGASSTTTLDPDQALLAFAACMREHGIDMPDPQIGSAGGGITFEFGLSSEGSEAPPLDSEMQKLQEAHEACSYLLEGVVQQSEQPDMAAMQDQLLAFSQCMRDHGIDMPDPVFGADGSATLIGPDAGGEGPVLDPADPDFQAAQEACQEQVFGDSGGMVFNTGPSAGVVGGVTGEGGVVIMGRPPDKQSGDG
jgi:hypothetical protein